MTIDEEKVVLNDGLVGILTRPSGNAPFRAVLLLHGFASQKDEVGNLFQRLAAGLANEQIMSLRIDFRGWGESAGDMAASTIEGQIADAQVASRFMTDRADVDPAHLGIVGFSLGGAIAILSAATVPSRYRSMVLWSSAGNLTDDFMGSLGEETVARAATDGIVNIDLGWRTVQLRRTFFDSLTSYDLQERIKHYSGALLAVAGTADFSSKYVQPFLAHCPGNPRAALLFGNGDHIFGVLGDDQTMAGLLLEQTISWLKRTL